MAGRAIFQQQNCASCHSGATFTDSALNSSLLHDVGTLRTSSGKRLNATLSGIDTPTLLGAWASAPYFHDGQAATLDDVFSVAGGDIYQAEVANLSGGAQVSGFQDINNDGQGHGALVSLRGTNSRVTFESVDGGQGGVGAIELRYRSDNSNSIRVNINGVERTLSISRPPVERQMRRIRLENVTLRAGTNNTIAVTKQGSLFLDDMTVSRADELSAAAAHRRVLGLSASQQRQIKRYVLELDGR